MIIYAKDDVVSLSGSLTRNEWLSIKAAANLLLREHPEGIIVDCGGLAGVTEDGARTFLDALRDIESADARIVVAAVPENVRESIRLVPGVRSRVPLATSVDEARMSLRGGAGHGVEGAQPVIVPLLEGLETSHAISIAADLSRSSRAPLLLLYLLEVGRSLPLGAPMPEQEEMATRQLDSAARDAAKAGIQATTHVDRVREIGEGLLHEIVRHDASLLIISARPERFSEQAFSTLVESLLAKAACNVLIARSGLPEGAPEMPAAGGVLGEDRRQSAKGAR